MVSGHVRYLDKSELILSTFWSAFSSETQECASAALSILTRSS